MRTTRLVPRRSISIELMPALLQFFLQLLAELDVFVKKIGVVLVGIPPRLPRFVVA